MKPMPMVLRAAAARAISVARAEELCVSMHSASKRSVDARLCSVMASCAPRMALRPMGDMGPVSAARTAMWVDVDASAVDGAGVALGVVWVLVAFGVQAATRHAPVMAEARMMVATLLRTAYIWACMWGIV